MAAGGQHGWSRPPAAPAHGVLLQMAIRTAAEVAQTSGHRVRASPRSAEGVAHAQQSSCPTSRRLLVHLPMSVHIPPSSLHLHLSSLHLHPSSLHLHPSSLRIHPSLTHIHSSSRHLHPSFLLHLHLSSLCLQSSPAHTHPAPCCIPSSVPCCTPSPPRCTSLAPHT